MAEVGNIKPQDQLPITRGVKTLLGDPKKAIIELSSPMIIAMLVQTTYNVADGIWVSGLGSDALAAIGLFFPIFMTVISLAAGISIGGSSAISRKIGAGDKEMADSAAVHTILISIGLAIFLSAALFIFIEDIFNLIGAGGQALYLALGYARILIMGTVIIVFSNIAGGILRGEGDTRRAMWAMVIGSGLNIILDPIFIYKLNLGIAGAAWATLISLLVSSTIFAFWLFVRKDTYVALKFVAFKFRQRITFEILRVGIPSSFALFSMALAMFILNIIVVKAGGTDGIAVFTSAWRIVMIGIVPLLGIAMGVTAVTGAAYGARDIEKLKAAYLYGVKIGFLVELAIVTLVVILAPQIARLFTYSKESAHISNDLIHALRWLVLALFTTPFGMVTSSMFRGIGRGENSLAVTILRTIVMQILFSYLFGITFGFGLVGIWWGIVLGNVTAGMIAFIWGQWTIGKLEGTMHIIVEGP